jgi:hypothetical protein
MAAPPTIDLGSWPFFSRKSMTANMTPERTHGLVVATFTSLHPGFQFNVRNYHETVASGHAPHESAA